MLLVPLLRRRHRGRHRAPTWPGPATGPSTSSSSTTATSPRSGTGWPPTRSSRRASTAWPRPSPPRASRRASGSRRSSPRPAPSWPPPTPSGWPGRPTTRRSRMIGMFNDIWGGFMYVLDITRPDVLDHLEAIAARPGRRRVPLPEAGLHLQRQAAGRATPTPPSRRPSGCGRAYEAVRRGAGEDTFLLGCGAPAGLAGRRGRRHAHRPRRRPHWWHRAPDRPAARLPGDASRRPGAPGASTLARAFLHRQLWLNDPDCLMLRTAETHG